MERAWLGPTAASTIARAAIAIDASFFTRFSLFMAMPHFLPSHSFGRHRITGDSAVPPRTPSG